MSINNIRQIIDDKEFKKRKQYIVELIAKR